MSRSVYGGAGASQVIDTTGAPKTAPATVYSTRTGGTVITDVQNIAGGALAGVVTPDAVGYVIFQGPDNYTAPLWLDFGSGPRWAVNPVNQSETANAAIAQVRSNDFNVGMTTTPKAGIHTNTANQLVNQVATDLDGKVIPTYPTSAARVTANPSPVDGDRGYRSDYHGMETYNSGLSRWVPQHNLIAETTFATSSTNVIFSGIPQTYRHLMVVWYGRATSGAAGSAYFQPVRMQMNTDSTNGNYQYNISANKAKTIAGTTNYAIGDDATGSGTSATSATLGHLMSPASSNAIWAGYVPGYSLPGSVWGGGQAVIGNYTQVQGHGVNATSGFASASGTSYYYVNSVSGGGWNPPSPAAVTSLTVYLVNSGMWTVGSVVSLYGLG